MLAAAPWVTVVGYETVGHRHNEAVLRCGLGSTGDSSPTPLHPSYAEWPPGTTRDPAPAADPKAERRQRLMSLDLTELAVEFGTDKWGVHRYTPHYQRHLEHLRDEKFVLLEIGIGGYTRKRRSGASLKMWQLVLPEGADRRPRHRGQVVPRRWAHHYLPWRPDRPRDPRSGSSPRRARRSS